MMMENDVDNDDVIDKKNACIFYYNIINCDYFGKRNHFYKGNEQYLYLQFLPFKSVLSDI